MNIYLIYGAIVMLLSMVSIDLGLKAIMLGLGYFLVSRWVAVEHRIWGIFGGISIVFLLHVFQSYIPPVPWGLTFFLLSYVVFGVGCKALYKPDPPAGNGGQ